MKILMICTEKLPVPAVRGGAIQTYIDGVSPTLAKNHDLTILGTTDDSLPNDEKVNNIRYVRTPGGLLEDYRDNVKQFLQSSEAESYDLIHIFNRPRLVLAVRECAPNARIVLSMHNDMFKLEKIDPEEAEAAIDQLDKIITVSDYIGKTISDLFPKAAGKLKTIYSGVDIDRFVPPHSKKALEMREEIRKEHNLNGKKVILFAGRLSANKGADILVQAMPLIAKKHSDIALVLVGSKWFSVNEVSDYVAYVRSLAARLPIPVVNTGFVAPSEIQKWFAAADVFVCPSQWQEPLARVHYEAMASGLPIITTARGGNPEVINPNENGYVVENPEEPQAFADLLIPLLSDPKLGKKLGLNGRKLAEDNFTWNRVINDISTVWDEVEHKIKNKISITAEQEADEIKEKMIVDTLDEENKVTTSEMKELDEQPTIIESVEVVDELEMVDVETNEPSTEPEVEAPVGFEELELVGEPNKEGTLETKEKVTETVDDSLEKEEEPVDINDSSQTEYDQVVDLSKHRAKTKKPRKLQLSDIINNPLFIDSLLSNVKMKTGTSQNDNETAQKIISDFEKLLKGQLDLQNPQTTREYIQSINDITSAKLFYKIANKKRRRRNN
ncbi:glycosyltransferase family 4 protein [Halalkalibacter krulwichiae]|uniref:Spore coat protein SA n=1 Tax=Halalkalibacter krulwichiae TaxID=199441 RepID=A0A1X9MF45_9BACI|nr:glycosyltransferase family 4 protein [Halalkalibacter krulwichiae]ARK30743.1 Spore coat protein SA [Halalkalibacter krulwichiae]